MWPGGSSGGRGRDRQQPAAFQRCRQSAGTETLPVCVKQQQQTFLPPGDNRRERETGWHAGERLCLGELCG